MFVFFFLWKQRGSARLEKFARSLNSDKWAMVEAHGYAGGIAMLWSDELGLICLWKTERLICCEVQPLGEEKGWKLLGVYRSPYRTEKKVFWNALDDLVSLWMDPRLIMGVLNELRNMGEKFGGKITSIRRWFLNEFSGSS